MITKSTHLIGKSLISYSDVTETRADLTVSTIFRCTVTELWKLLFIIFMTYFSKSKVLVIVFELLTVSSAS